MSASRSILTRRKRSRNKSQSELPLTAMLDIMTIILVFLLKSFSTSTVVFPTPPDLELPISKSQEVPTDSPHVIITPEAIIFENERVVEFVQTVESLAEDIPTYIFPSDQMDEGGLRIVPLYDALIKAREQSELLRAQSKYRDEQGRPLPFEGVLAIQADKSVSYQTLQKVFYTAAAAEFKLFRLLARREKEF